jgi:hypothetical protein
MTIPDWRVPPRKASGINIDDIPITANIRANDRIHDEKDFTPAPVGNAVNAKKNKAPIKKKTENFGSMP